MTHAQQSELRAALLNAEIHAKAMLEHAIHAETVARLADRHEKDEGLVNVGYLLRLKVANITNLVSYTTHSIIAGKLGLDQQPAESFKARTEDLVIPPAR